MLPTELLLLLLLLFSSHQSLEQICNKILDINFHTTYNMVCVIIHVYVRIVNACAVDTMDNIGSSPRVSACGTRSISDQYNTKLNFLLQREVLESSTSPTGSVIAYTVCNVSVHWLSFLLLNTLHNCYSSISYTSQFKLNK